MSDSLVLATHSFNKIKEISVLLADLPLAIESGISLKLPEADETGNTFEENALLKARSSAEYTNILSLADDSGFCIPDLDNFPGLYSKRWAQGNYIQAFKNLAELLAKKNLTPPVSAFFQTVLALAWPDGKHRFYKGRIDGFFVTPPRPAEDQGRAYDPAFMPFNQLYSPAKTFGEMTLLEKANFSHRAQAVTLLKKDFPWIP